MSIYLEECEQVGHYSYEQRVGNYIYKIYIGPEQALSGRATVQLASGHRLATVAVGINLELGLLQDLRSYWSIIRCRRRDIQ